ncbi:hypothetical protein R1flu_024509 [Riccia fluitans]|uniref:Uncharacterized protein n=1 Tax=Riccia fluitans TaxID=41844 RepID=A0ABD1XV30_9MARC
MRNKEEKTVDLRKHWLEFYVLKRSVEGDVAAQANLQALLKLMEHMEEVCVECKGETRRKPQKPSNLVSCARDRSRVGRSLKNG